MKGSAGKCGPYVCEFPDPSLYPAGVWMCPRCKSVYYRKRQSRLSKLWQDFRLMLGLTAWYGTPHESDPTARGYYWLYWRSLYSRRVPQGGKVK